MKHKFFKYFSIVILNIFLIAVFVELAAYIDDLFERKAYEPYYPMQFKTFEDSYEHVTKNLMVKPIGLEYKNRPVVIMGCSFAYGYGIDVNDSFAGRLSEVMQRPVYNRGFEWAWGPQNMLYQARREDFYKEVPNPEYLIFIAIDDHPNRVCAKHYWTRIWYPYLHYVMKNGRLEKDDWHFWDNLYAYKIYSNYKLSKMTDLERFNIFDEHLIEAKQEFDKHWKNYKFIVLFYAESEANWLMFFNNSNIKRLEENGIIVLDTKEITGRYMDEPEDTLEDKFHPSASAWEFITPQVAKRLEEL